jgi:polar amino acid transport system substrate-binding protein
MGTQRYVFVIFILFLTYSTIPGTLAETEGPGPVDTTGPVHPAGNISLHSVHDLIAFVEEAKVFAERVGKEAALREFSQKNGSFTLGNLYIWAYDFNGVNLAHPWHPEYTGNNKLDLADPSGFRMIEAMRDAARAGSGYVWYQFENPVYGDIEPKLAFVKRVDDTWWLASGIYGEGLTLPPDAPESIRTVLTDKVRSAIGYYQKQGKEEALTAFNNPEGPFVTNETYVFAFDTNGTSMAMPLHPDKVGTNEKDLTDINGVSIGGEKLMLASEGGGFSYYVFDNPNANGNPEFKISYIEPASSNLIVGTGMYLRDIPVTFSDEKREALKSKVEQAAIYIQDKGRIAAIDEFNDLNGNFSDPGMFIFAFDTNGTLLANPFLPGLVGMNRMSDQDMYGKYPVKQLIANALNGGGYTYYFFADPESDYAIRLKLGYTIQAPDDVIVGAGIFTEKSL